MFISNALQLGPYDSSKTVVQPGEQGWTLPLPQGTPPLTTQELVMAERYLVKLSQEDDFPTEIALLKGNCSLPATAVCCRFIPFWTPMVYFVSEAEETTQNCPIRKCIPSFFMGNINSQNSSFHLLMLHAGPTLASSMLTCRFHIICLRKAVRSVTHQCVTCRLRPPDPNVKCWDSCLLSM